MYREVLKMRIWGVPLAGGLLLWLITALAGPRNIANEWMNNAVIGLSFKLELTLTFSVNVEIGCYDTFPPKMSTIISSDENCPTILVTI